MCFSVDEMGPVCGKCAGGAVGLLAGLCKDNLVVLTGVCFLYPAVSEPSQPSSSPLGGGGLRNGHCYFPMYPGLLPTRLIQKRNGQWGSLFSCVQVCGQVQGQEEE